MQINVNGQTYTRWEDIPADVRQQLAATLPDADKNAQALGWAGPGAAAVPPPPGTPAAPATANSPWPLQPGEVMLNGVSTVVGDSIEVKKPWWKRLFGG